MVISLRTSQLFPGDKKTRDLGPQMRLAFYCMIIDIIQMATFTLSVLRFLKIPLRILLPFTVKEN